MRTVDLKPDIYSYNAMLRAVVRGRGLDQGFVVVTSINYHFLISPPNFELFLEKERK